VRQPPAAAWLAVPLLVGLTAGGCAGDPPPRAPSVPPPSAGPRAAAPGPVGSFWEETPFAVGAPRPAKLDPRTLVPAGLAARFGALTAESKAELLDRGVLAVPRPEHTGSLGEVYLSLARSKVPFVVTLDALFGITLRAVECALEEVDENAVAPALSAALGATDERLAAEAHAARSDTARAYAIARGVVAVGRALLDPSAELDPATPPDVRAELAKVLAHAGPDESPLLGRPLDYGAFDTQAGLAFGDPRIPTFRAATWVARVPLALGADGDLDVAATRDQTRAAVLLTRDAGDAWKRLASVRAFAVGAGDDPGPAELASAARALGIHLRDEAAVGDVVRVDRLRRALVRAAGATLEDTGGRLPTFRLLSPSAPPDARALQRVASVPGELPSALAVGLALGSSEARGLLEHGGGDARALDDVARELPAGARHASLHATGLDAIAAYLAPSALDAGRTWRQRPAHGLRKLEVALAAWTALRHAAVPFARRPARDVIDEPVVAFDGAPGAVEPHPEAIARLLSMARQAQRGLAAVGGLRQGGAAWTLLDRVAALLDDALAVATSQDRKPLRPELAHALATMPSRIAAIERRLGPAASPDVVVTAADPSSHRVLEDGTGQLDEVWLAVDVGGAVSLFVGARVPFYETIATLRATDASWARHLVETPPPRPAWERAFSSE
jgi:hypothetical protein